MTLLELTMSIAMMTIALLALSHAILFSKNLSRVNRETALANAAGRQMIEVLQSTDFAQLFALYNGDGADDPGGVAPGNGFAVRGLTPIEDDEDGLVGRVAFPTLDDDLGELREDVVDVSLGMPRDLNGDGAVDGEDHSSDYRLLPVCVRIEWTGVTGDRGMEFRTLIVDR